MCSEHFEASYLGPCIRRGGLFSVLGSQCVELKAFVKKHHTLVLVCGGVCYEVFQEATVLCSEHL